MSNCTYYMYPCGDVLTKEEALADYRDCVKDGDVHMWWGYDIDYDGDDHFGEEYPGEENALDGLIEVRPSTAAERASGHGKWVEV
jgi:hypothetical protein